MSDFHILARLSLQLAFVGECTSRVELTHCGQENGLASRFALWHLVFWERISISVEIEALELQFLSHFKSAFGDLSSNDSNGSMVSTISLPSCLRSFYRRRCFLCNAKGVNKGFCVPNRDVNSTE